MNEVATIEDRLAARIDPQVTGQLAVTAEAGGLAFANMREVLEFSKVMACSGVAIPKHLRGNAGACLAVSMQAVEWKMSPFAVANKSYSVNDRLAYESQLIQAVILQRAPIKGRIKFSFDGEGDKRVCTATAVLADGTGEVEYKSPPFGEIQPKNSPLWKNDRDQQHCYYSGRAMCRRYFPDVILGVYADDEIEESPRQGPEHAKDITPKSLSGKLDELARDVDEKEQRADEEQEAPAEESAGETTEAAPEITAEQRAEMERVAGLHEAAKARARKGKKAFDRWYQTLSEADADVVDQIRDVLREIAVFSDAKSGEQAA